MNDTNATNERGLDGITERLRTIRDGLCVGLVERDVPVRLALLAAVSGEHLLLLGPPGTAKSLIARRLHLAFADATYFERLLTRFSVPEELFGPLSIKGLEEDRYERQTDRYLPTASVAFLDEIFKANSAILNALLTLLNEREFDNGVKREKTPLIAVVGASNELPQGEELDALYDRFLLRLHVGPVSESGFDALLNLRGESTPDVPDSARLTEADIAAIRSAARNVELSDDVRALLKALRTWCMAEGIPVSDRRWRKVVNLLQTSAVTNGRDAVSIWDCWLLQHCLWQAPEQRQALFDWYAERVGASAAMDPTSLTALTVALENAYHLSRTEKVHARDTQGRHLYAGLSGHTEKPVEVMQASRDGEPLFLAPARAWRSRWTKDPVSDRTGDGKGFTRSELDALYVDQQTTFEHWRQRATYLVDESNFLIGPVDLPPVMIPMAFDPVIIEHRLAEIDSAIAQVGEYSDGVDQRRRSTETELSNHLWALASFHERATATLDETAGAVAALRRRLEAVREGTANLPRADVRTLASDASEPRPAAGGKADPPVDAT